jgi:hypothetical protein
MAIISRSVARRGRRVRVPLGVEGLESRCLLSGVPLGQLPEPPPEPALTEFALVSSLRPALDLNADTVVDAIWRNTVTGENIGWIYNTDGDVTSTRYLGGDSDWAIDDVGDFDGNAVTDLVWRNTAGSTVIWLMQADGAILSQGFIGGDATWRLEASGDYNGDTRDDVVWRDSVSGFNVMWLMDGTTATAEQMIGGDLFWRLASTSADYDSNADGMADLIWNRTTGAKVLHRMNGTSVISAAVLSMDDHVTLAGTGDFNGDGRHDLLWRNSSTGIAPGMVIGWLMDDGTIISSALIGGDLSWAVNNTADVNGDGKTDIIWRDSSGGTVVWLMNSFNALENVVLGGDATWTLIRRPGVHAT